MKLYAHPFSSYCQKVLVALYENDTPFELRLLAPGDELRRAIPIVASALWLACAAGIESTTGWIPCTFLPIEEEARDTIARCALPGADGRLAIAPAALEVLAVRGVDPATVTLGGELHYLNAAGVAVSVLPFDNGADYFVEGFARTVRDGKVGFVDEALSVVIPPAWDFAFPFEDGAAVVCEGCSFRPAGDGHREVVGGRWGVIDRRGRLVVPLVQSREALRAIHPRQEVTRP